MDPARFWQVIDTWRAAARAPGRDPVAALYDTLRGVTPGELLGFQRELFWFVGEAKRGDVFGAASLMHGACADGACTDDAWLAFRLWLVAQGRAAFEAALADPDALAAVAEVAAGFEPLRFAAEVIFEDKTGDDFDDAYDATSAPVRPHTPDTFDARSLFAPDRIPFDMDFERARHVYPRLCAWLGARARRALPVIA